MRSVNKAIEQNVIEARRVARQVQIPATELAPVVLLHAISKNVALAPEQKRAIRDWLVGLDLSRIRGPRDMELAPSILVRLDRQLVDQARRATQYAQVRDRHIVSDPKVKGGEPVIQGTRLTVSAIAARLDGGDSIDDLIEDYPYIPREAFEAARLYAKTHPRRGRPPQPWRERGSEVTRR